MYMAGILTYPSLLNLPIPIYLNSGILSIEYDLLGQDLQLRGQFWIFTKFPLINPKTETIN
jgi:hypothetical protein